jgi:multidrug transporter EmrE-like cation transporter
MNRIQEKKMYHIILQVLPVLIFSYVAQVLMKKGSVVFSNLTWETFLANPLKTLGLFLFNWQIMLGFLLAGIGAIIYLLVLSKNDFGVVFPVLGALGFLVLPLISWLVLNEAISLGRIFGTVIIAIGMLIVARG